MFMQWAIDTLLNEHPEPAIVGDGCGEATFPSLQALRDASHAVEMVRELTAHEARDAANSWSSGDGDITDGGSGSDRTTKNIFRGILETNELPASNFRS